MSGDGSLARVSALFETLAAVIEARKSDETVHSALAALKAVCAQTVAQELPRASKDLVSNISTAIQTWEQVWPRLGGQPEFRLAVAREARMWAKRFQELGQRP